MSITIQLARDCIKSAQLKHFAYTYSSIYTNTHLEWKKVVYHKENTMTDPVLLIVFTDTPDIND